MLDSFRRVPSVFLKQFTAVEDTVVQDGGSGSVMFFPHSRRVFFSLSVLLVADSNNQEHVCRMCLTTNTQGTLKGLLVFSMRTEGACVSNETVKIEPEAGPKKKKYLLSRVV